MLGMAYLERFTKWSEILKPRPQVQGETMAGLVEAIALERRTNRGKARAGQWAFIALLIGLKSPPRTQLSSLPTWCYERRVHT
jgi:hypothetical protein